MPRIELVGDTLSASGDVGYEEAGQFAKLCDRFMDAHRTRPGVIDLSQVGDFVSPCLTAIYDDARLYRPTAVKVVAPKRMEDLFSPGEIEGLFTLEAI